MQKEGFEYCEFTLDSDYHAKRSKFRFHFKGPKQSIYISHINKKDMIKVIYL